MTKADDNSQRSRRTARFYFNGAMHAGSELELDKQASHHLLTVLRARPGTRLIVFNGDGNNYHATLAQDTQPRGTKQALLHIETAAPANNESPLHTTLIQCVSRPERMDISIRQSVELGVKQIQPLYSRHSIKPGDAKRVEKKQQHWQSLIISSCEQCGRAALPVLQQAMSFQQWLQTGIADDEIRFVLSPDADTSLSQQAHLLAAAPQPEHVRISLIIGPESGLDVDEIDAAIKGGATPANLGDRILRTETAGPTCMTLLQSILGDLKPHTLKSTEPLTIS